MTRDVTSVPTPTAPAAVVESAPAGGGLTPTPGHHFMREVSNGSDRLTDYPPTGTELHYASIVFHEPDNRRAALHLRTITGSAKRAAAIIRHVHREADSQHILSRAIGPTTRRGWD